MYSSSLLIVYEGDVQSEPAPEEGACAGASAGEYDADASSSSAELAPSPGHFDMSTLHDEISVGARRERARERREPREPREPFTPHSEETMGGYEEGEVGGHSPRRHPPSPDSADSWMAYSSTSSESWRGDTDTADAEADECGKRARTRTPTWRPVADRVDIRMIDFAHTAFAGAAAESPLATATPHHGPDCGFLTGVDSLKRLLTDILPPQPYS